MGRVTLVLSFMYVSISWSKVSIDAFHIFFLCGFKTCVGFLLPFFFVWFLCDLDWRADIFRCGVTQLHSPRLGPVSDRSCRSL